MTFIDVFLLQWNASTKLIHLLKADFSMKDH